VRGEDRVTAPAKLTLSLRVVRRRDDGYHDLEAEMVSLDLCDELYFSPDRDGLDLEDARVRRSPELSLGPDNLVRRALSALGRRAHVHLVKRIPVEGGLGGGSTDAGAVLRWADCDDLALAASLGGDVPFCVAGGRARVEGLGEVVAPLPHVDRHVVLLLPPFGVSTVAVFQAWDVLDHPLQEADDPRRNDLTSAALAVEPRLAAWRDCFAEWTGLKPTLAGSGSTWFVEVPSGLSTSFGGELVLGAERAPLIAARTVPALWDGQPI
jgi:4-diphosphocytidyl-2-C-methyl-D-erythritol kinase